MNPLATLFTGALVLSFALVLVVIRPVSSSKSALRRLETIQESVHFRQAAGYADELNSAARVSFPYRLNLFLERYRLSKQVKMLLIHANSSMTLSSVFLSSAGASFACGSLCFVLVSSFALAGAVASAAFAIPCGLLQIQRARRLKAFNLALPDAIDLMARSLLAGHSMGSSIELVAEQSPEPLSFEFVQVYQQQRLGLHFRDALLQMGSRVPSRDLQFLITAILVQKETGGDLTEILARASHVIRERVRIEGEVRTRTAQGRLTGWILALLPVVLLALICIVTPEYSGVLFQDPLGRKLYAGITLIALGALIIRKIVDVKV